MLYCRVPDAEPIKPPQEFDSVGFFLMGFCSPALADGGAATSTSERVCGGEAVAESQWDGKRLMSGKKYRGSSSRLPPPRLGAGEDGGRGLARNAGESAPRGGAFNGAEGRDGLWGTQKGSHGSGWEAAGRPKALLRVRGRRQIGPGAVEGGR